MRVCDGVTLDATGMNFQGKQNLDQLELASWRMYGEAPGVRKVKSLIICAYMVATARIIVYWASRTSGWRG